MQKMNHRPSKHKPHASSDYQARIYVEAGEAKASTQPEKNLKNEGGTLDTKKFSLTLKNFQIVCQGGDPS